MSLLWINRVSTRFQFELEQNTFGGDFEFVFVEEDNDELTFRSKSDNSTMTLVPAGANDDALISIDAVSTLIQGIFQEEDLGGIGGVGFGGTGLSGPGPGPGPGGLPTTSPPLLLAQWAPCTFLASLSAASRAAILSAASGTSASSSR